MHPNLEKAIEDFKRDKLPKPPELKCPHCGKTLLIGGITTDIASFNPDGSLYATFKVTTTAPRKIAGKEVWPIT